MIEGSLHGRPAKPVPAGGFVRLAVLRLSVPSTSERRRAMTKAYASSIINAPADAV
jgi:hypothetical protein